MRCFNWHSIRCSAADIYATTRAKSAAQRSTDPIRLIQTAVAHAGTFVHFDLHRDSLLKRFNVTDNANGFHLSIEVIQSIERHLQGFIIQSAKAFV